MLYIGSHVRYFYYNGTVDMRKGSYSLSGIVRNEMRCDVLTGDVFVFISRRGNKIKLLQWDADGFALYEKRLEKGIFERPVVSSEQNNLLTSVQLQHILQGVILSSVKCKKRYNKNL